MRLHQPFFWFFWVSERNVVCLIEAMLAGLAYRIEQVDRSAKKIINALSFLLAMMKPIEGMREIAPSVARPPEYVCQDRRRGHDGDTRLNRS